MDSKTRITVPECDRSPHVEGARLPRSGGGRHAAAVRRASQVSWLLAAAAVLASVRDVSGADICFQPTACVSTSTVLLRDIAIVRASDAATMTRLENVALAPAPAPGRRMRLDFAEIRSRLEATGIPAVELNYSGSSVVVVASADVLLPVKAKPKKMPQSESGRGTGPAQAGRTNHGRGGPPFHGHEAQRKADEVYRRDRRPVRRPLRPGQRGPGF